jgi:predicted AlkP superfamily pyrophosphatase or phosphodiesterase
VRLAAGLLSSLTLVLTTACGGAPKKALEVVLEGESRNLRERSQEAPQNAPQTPPLLFLAFDGVSRDLLYDMLRKGELPNLAALLGGDDLKHAHLDETVLSTLPSSTMAAWATMMTGLTPAEHGVTGNEYFARESMRFECPAPVTFEDAAPTFEIYTDDYMNKLIDGPTVYEKMKVLNGDSLIWVAMHSIFRGADRLLMARRTIVGKAFEAFVVSQVKKISEGKTARDVFSGLDDEVIDVLVEKLEDEDQVIPDVITLYLSGTDLYAHVAAEGPDTARREYLKEVIDPEIADLVAVMRKRNMLAKRWVVISSDHGHTEVEEKNNIDTQGPQAVLEKTGFVVRKFERHIDDDDTFSSVLAFGGAMAYVYLADRTTCDKEGECSWVQPPRYKEDVLATAEAFRKANATGELAPELKGRLDMILVREGKPAGEIDNPFVVYVGDGKTKSISDYLASEKHPTYVEVESRLKDLAVGVHGDHAGDILLIANNGNMKTPGERFYFSHPYKSWHGSPSREDSEIPMIVANAGKSTKEIAAWVKTTLGDRPSQQRIANVLVGLRKNPP